MYYECTVKLFPEILTLRKKHFLNFKEFFLDFTNFENETKVCELQVHLFIFYLIKKIRTILYNKFGSGGDWYSHKEFCVNRWKKDCIFIKMSIKHGVN